MELKPDRLERQLAGEPLRPVYLVAGGEPLLVQEAADAIRARAREEGYGEREVYDADDSFNWNTLTQGVASLSLFATRRLFDLRLPSGKPGKDGSEALREYCDKLPPDTVLLITAQEWSKAHAGNWSEAIAKVGHLVVVYPLKTHELGEWLQRRLRSRGLLRHARRGASAGRPRRRQPAGRGPGSGQAGAAGGRGQGPEVRGHRRGADGAAGRRSSRFDVFKLIDAALAGEAVRAVRMLAGLRAEGDQVAGLMPMVAEEVLALCALARAAESGNVMSAMRDARIWESKQAIYRRALERHSAAALGSLRRRMRPHRPHLQGPRRRRRLADARAPAGRHRRRPGAQAAGLMALALFYGGTFDPVHAGHLAVAAAARDALGADVAFLPAADPPHRATPGASAAQRAHMLDLAIADEPGFTVDRRELHRDGPSYTADTLREPARRTRPRCAAGMAGRRRRLPRAGDLARVARRCSTWRISSWPYGPAIGLEALPEDLGQACAGRWLDRPGALAERPAGGLFRLDMPLHPASATELRRRLRAGEPHGGWLCAPVAEFIDREGLYRGGTAPAGV